MEIHKLMLPRNSIHKSHAGIEYNRHRNDHYTTYSGDKREALHAKQRQAKPRQRKSKHNGDRIQY